MNKVIFLDIDGPMIPATMHLIDNMCSWQRRFPETTVAVLERLCERTGAKIVFNTTHNRSMEGVPDIEVALMDHNFSGEHIHPTDPKTAYPRAPRRCAVEDWLAAHPEVTHWVALDDARFTDDERLIWVDPDAGLHIGHLNLAIEKLGGEPVIILI